MKSNNEIIEIFQAGCPEFIQNLRKTSKKLQMHVYGKNAVEYLDKVIGFETQKQFNLREKYKITNKFLVDKLLRQCDNIFSAKGGSVNYEMPKNMEEAFTGYLNKMLNGMSIDDFLKDVAFDKYIVDPGGLLFTETITTKEGVFGKPVYHSIFSILNYEINGIQPNWIAYEPLEEKDIYKLIKKYPNKITFDDKDKEKYTYQWFVDEKNYYLYKGTLEKNEKGNVVNREFSLVHSIVNFIGEIPAVTCSNLISSETNHKISPINNQIELLDSYFRKNSIKEVYENLHLFPIAWVLLSSCNACKGTGYEGEHECTECNGSGYSLKKEVSDIIGIEPPEDKESPTITNVGGYITPPEKYDEQVRTELDWLFNLAYESQWGTKYVDISNIKTATGQNIDFHAITNKLNKYGDWLELTKQKLIYFIGKTIFTMSFKNAFVKVGRRYIVESPDMLLEKYHKFRNSGAPEDELNYVWEQYLYAEFGKNDKQYNYHILIFKLDPFFHKTLEQVRALQVPPTLYNRKFYLSQFLKDIDYEIYNLDYKKALEKLEEYINNLNFDQNGTTKTGEEN